MKLRTIVIVLSLLAFLSVSGAAYLYYSSLVDAEYRDAEQGVALQAERLRNALSAYLAENQKTVKAMAGLPEVQEALAAPDPAAIGKANALLDHFREVLKADVCYLMDRRGTTVASSNRSAPDSFVGQNFAFRPYWREAIGGAAATYMALGVTSNRRGIYYGHPVSGARGEGPVGVAVIKAPVERIEEEFGRAEGGIVLLTDPHGIVFVSSRKEWLFRSLRTLSPEETALVARSQQFGPGPWPPAGLAIGVDRTARDGSGEKFLAYQMKVGASPGWSVVYLRPAREIARKIYGPLLDVTGTVLLTLCVLVGLAVLFLYRRASDDLVRAQDRMRRLSDSIIEGQEEERAAVSRELHDELGQLLTALQLDAAWLGERLRGADDGARARARAICDLSDQAIDEVRRLAARLRPGALDKLGLVDALEWYVGDFEKRTGIACRFRHAGVARVNDPAATATYRITQEALTNVARHARATRVDVSLEAKDGCMVLAVEDDGRGFDLRALRETGGLGVAGMRERAALIGGALDVRSRPGEGTRVALRVGLGPGGEAVH